MHRIALLILITLAAGCRGVTAPSPAPDRAADETCRRMSEDPDLGNVVVTGDTMFATRHDLVFTGRLSHHVTGRPVELVRFVAWVDSLSTYPYPRNSIEIDGRRIVVKRWYYPADGREYSVEVGCGRLRTGYDGRYRVSAPLNLLPVGSRLSAQVLYNGTYHNEFYYSIPTIRDPMPRAAGRMPT